MTQKVILASNLKLELAKAISECEHDRIFILTDETTYQKCLPLISDFFSLKGAHHIVIPATDSHKDLVSLSHVWQELSTNGATRHSLLINLGGGMVTDLGGFAAATFKRGINFINIPTTLLAMVDASVGGKTGVNFCGLKNEIGVFQEAHCVLLDTHFLATLDAPNILSGYAEMLKHGLLSTVDDKDCNIADLINFDIEAACNHDDNALHQLGLMVASSVSVKERVVTQDPQEQGIRKALNLGHTFGHAFESYSFRQNKPLLHGYAVAHGLIPELYLCATRCQFSTSLMHQAVNFIRQHYGTYPITCDDYDALTELMQHDKKNKGGHILCTLLAAPGDLRLDQQLSKDDITEALDFYSNT